jgi:3-dehydroquinate synthase
LDIVSGLGEVFKFHILQNKINEFSFEPNFLDVIRDSLQYKKTILEIDEFDLKERQYLNFGHTFGHALEATSQHKIPHGIAVILGCMIAINVSKRLGFCVLNEELIYSIGHTLISSSNIEFDSEWFNPPSLIEITKSDKKSKGNLTMVLMNRGKPFLETVTNLDIVTESINYIYESI